MRLFVAVRLSDELKSTITDTMHQLKKQGVKGNYIPAQNLHLTLAFIGEVEDVRPVREVLQSLKVRSFRLSFSDMGTFGDLLWIGLRGNQGLSAVVKDVRAALDGAGIDYDRKKFVPHITIIRRMTGRWQSVSCPKGEMMVKSISLMKSEVKNGKRVYTDVLQDCGAGK